MASIKELENQLSEAGTKLLNSRPASSNELLQLLNQVETCLLKIDQSPSESTQAALSPLLKALVDDELLWHSDIDVRVAISACLSEITRISAPEAPYEDDQMKEVFKLIVSSFENLSDSNSQSYAKRMSILETVAKVRSCVVMLDLECDALILEMFQHFVRAIRDYHPEHVFESMETIMTLVLEESEDISPELLSPLLETVKKDNNEVLPVAQKLADKVLKTCAAKLSPWLVQAVKSLGMSAEDFSEVVASIFQESPDASDQNDTHVASEQLVSLEERAKVASSELVNPAAEKPHEPVISNGIMQAVDKDTLCDTSFVKNQDQGLNDLSKTINTSSDAEPEGVTSAKVEDESNSEQTSGTKARKPPSSKIPNISHVDNEKELDNEIQEKELCDEPGNVNSHDKEVPNEVNSDKAEEEGDLNEPNGNKSLEKEVPSEPDNDKTLAKEVLRKSNGDKNVNKEIPSELDGVKTLEKDVAVSHAADVQGKEDPSSANNQEAEEEVPNLTNKKTMEAVSNSPDNEQEAEKDVSSLSDSERTIDDKLAAETVMPSENEDENVVQSSSSKKLDQNADDGMLSPNEDPDEKTTRKSVRSNKKHSLKETAVPANDEGKEVSEVASDLGRRPRRDTSKKAPVEVSGVSKSPATADVTKTRKKGDAESKQSGKENIAKSSAKGSGKKRSRDKVVKNVKESVSVDERSSSEKDEHKETRSSSKKLNKGDGQLQKTPKAFLKGKRKASDVKTYDENLVGAKVKVFWPEDVEYYPGKVESFDASKKKHRVFYDDGEVEVLKLNKEIWEFIDDSESEEEKAAAHESPDASSQRPHMEKNRSSHGANQVKGSASYGKRGASSSKSKGTVAKFGTKSRDTSSSSSSSKMKGKVTPNASAVKPKHDLPSKLKGKHPRSSGKSDAIDDTHSGSSKAKGKESISEGPDKVKGKSSQSSNARLSESKFGRKRQKVTKS